MWTNIMQMERKDIAKKLYQYHTHKVRGGHKMSINYQEEVTKLQTQKEINWFKPEAGQYNILVTAEPERIQKTFEKKVNNETINEEVEQLRLNIEVDKKPFVWDIGVGQTTNSIYGQLMLLGKAKGKLMEEHLNLLVKRSNNKNDYTIMEALPYMKVKEEKVENDSTNN